MSEEVVAELRRVLERDGRTRYAVSKASGIGQDMLSRFVSGERGISFETAAKLADALGLRLALVPKDNKRKSRR